MGLVVTTKTGNRVSPSNFDQTLARLVKQAGVPRLTSHGLRHTAATHMVRHAADMGEMRAAADLLGHSPDMLIKVYAHAPPRISTNRDRQDRPTSLRVITAVTRNTRLPTVRRAHRVHFPQLLPRAMSMMRMPAVDCNSHSTCLGLVAI